MRTIKLWMGQMYLTTGSNENISEKLISIIEKMDPPDRDCSLIFDVEKRASVRREKSVNLPN